MSHEQNSKKALLRPGKTRDDNCFKKNGKNSLFVKMIIAYCFFLLHVKLSEQRQKRDTLHI
jgi:hypothetical protein